MTFFVGYHRGLITRRRHVIETCLVLYTLGTKKNTRTICVVGVVVLGVVIYTLVVTLTITLTRIGVGTVGRL